MLDPAGAMIPPDRQLPIPPGVPVEDGSAFAASAAKLLKAQRKQLKLPHLKIHTVAEFVALTAARSGLKQKQKITIAEQALLLFKELYPHLTFKEEFYDFARPLEHLEGLVKEIRERDIPDREFHTSMICVFALVVDPHTIYGLPKPYRGTIAFLPFQIRAYRDTQNFPRFIITKVMNTEGHPHDFFVRGAEVTHWNGDDTADYVVNSHGRLAAGNYRARVSRGCIFSTVRPLTYCLMPEESAAVLHYIPPESNQTHAISFPWTIATGMEARTTLPSTTFSVSESTRITSNAEQVMVHRDDFLVQQRQAAAIAAATPFLSQPSINAPQDTVDLEQESLLPKVFQFQYTGGKDREESIDPRLLRDGRHPDAKFGYIRIRDFGGDSTRGMVIEFRRILEVMNRHAPRNLILDVRGNPGGDVNASEQMLQMLTPNRITPINFQMTNGGPLRSALRKLKGQNQRRLKGEIEGRPLLSANREVRVIEAVADLRPWMDSADEVPDGVLSVEHPLTTIEQANAIGQVYHGMVVLLVDAMSYSSADIFAAGFQDNLVGLVVGVDPNTGGGGANVWTHDDLVRRLPSTPDLPVRALPEGVTMTVAIRRCSRVGVNSGVALEDAGVHADIQFDPISPGEVVEGFESLIRRTCQLIGISRDSKVTLHGCVLSPEGIRVTADVNVAEHLILMTTGREEIGKLEVKPGDGQQFTIPVPDGMDLCGRSLRLEGYIRDVVGHGTTELIMVAASNSRPVLSASPH